MADPMKTTVQEALDHINAWIAQGEKDKAIKGLEEVLGFDPGNTQAASMLAGLKVAAPTKLDIELKPSVAPAAAPAPTATAPSAPPAPTPPTPQPMSSMPAPTLKPVSSITPPPENKTSEQEATTTKVQNLSDNVKWMIFAGALIFAIIGGYLFYKNFLGASEPLVNDIQAQVEQQDIVNPEPSITPDNTLAPIDDTPLDDVPTVDTATDTTANTSTSSDTTSGDTPNEKVKRR